MDLLRLVFWAVILYLLVRWIYRMGNSNGSKRSTTSRFAGPDDAEEIGSLSAEERRLVYKIRGKSPSGVIDGVYNDMYRENDKPYSDMDRDWDADA